MVDSEENDDEIMNKVRIFSSDDEKLKMLGELLSNKSSRDIIKLLINSEMYTNEIADKLDLRVNLVIHHLKKLEELGLLQIQNKEITKKGIPHRYFRMTPHFFVAPNYTKEDLEKKGTLKNFFKDGIKFSIITLASVASWVTGVFYNSQEIDVNASYSKDVDVSFFFIPIIIIGCSLFLIWVSKKYK